VDTVSNVEGSVTPRGRFDAGEVGFVASVVVVLLVITALPYAFGYVAAPSEKQFMGVLFDVHDTTQYLSWMRESGSRLLIENKLTSEPNARIFFNLQWWLLGRFARILGLPLLQVYQLFRVLTIGLFVAVCYRFCRAYFRDRWKARIALLMAAVGGGLGWVWVVAKQFTGELLFPNDVYTIPGNTFFSLLAVPHVAFAAVIIIATLWLGFCAVGRAQWRYTLAAGFLALLLGMSHIYDLVTVWAGLAVLGLLFVLRDGFSWGLSGRLAGVVVLSLPAPLYYGYISIFTPVWREALSQYDNLQTFTPDPFHLLIFMGLPLVVALFTFRGLVPLKSLSQWQVFVRGWLVTGLLLVYLPLKFQIMLLNGLQIPVALLAVEGLYDDVLPWAQERWRCVRSERGLRWAGLGFVALVLPLNLYLCAWRFVDLRRAEYPYFLYRDDVAALEWLEQNANPDDVVLTSLHVGHFLPGLSGTKAFLSSGVMTLDFVEKEEMVQRFFTSSTTDDQRRKIIETYGIQYVLSGPAERRLGDFDPATSALFEPAFEATHTRVFRVQGRD
jgi:hypothetical protein